jgi:hypothetical protein
MSLLNASDIPQNFSCSAELYQQELWMYVHSRTRNTLEDRGELRLEMLLSESAGQLEFTEFSAFRECDRCDLYYVNI